MDLFEFKLDLKTLLLLCLIILYLLKDQVVRMIFKTKRISCQKLKELSDQGIILIVDVRTENEFKNYSIPGSVNIPLHHITEVGMKEKYKTNENIYLICASGTRSLIAAVKMKRWGYDNCFSVSKGLRSWRS